MPTKRLRAVVSVFVVGGALSLLLFSTMAESADYYKHVDEVMSNPAEWYDKAMNLHGFVVDGSIQKRQSSLDYRFQVKTGDAVVLAHYSGVVPDTFKDGAEVVLTGKLTPEGFKVKPGGVTAKCPSKYDPAQAAGNK
jgi:cytochrome c-type biogenesis protein CcmE